jgi:predicted phosphodiesterase
MGQKGVLDRLSGVAPVLATRNARMDPTDGGERIAERNRVLEVNGVRIGATFELASGLENKPEPGKLPLPEGEVQSYLSSAFGQPVDVVAFGGTHIELEEERGGVLFFNPGSPTIPMTRPQGSLGTVAILDVSGPKPAVQIVSLEASQEAG